MLLAVLAALALLVTATGPAAAEDVSTAAAQPTLTLIYPTTANQLYAGTPFAAVAQLSLDDAAGARCVFMFGGGAYETTPVDPDTGLCTAVHTYQWGATYTLSVVAYDGVGYAFGDYARVPVDGPSMPPRCDGTAATAAGCEYHWVESWVDADVVTHYRVCALDGGCQWLDTYSQWPLTTGGGYLNSTPDSSQLPDGNYREHVYCLGSSPQAWTGYASTGDMSAVTSDVVASRPPLPAETCAAELTALAPPPAPEIPTLDTPTQETPTPEAPSPDTSAPNPTPAVYQATSGSIAAQRIASSGSRAATSATFTTATGEPLAGQTVTLWSHTRYTTWAPLGTAVTSATGRVSAQPAVRYSTALQWRFGGATTSGQVLLPSVTSAATITVTPKIAITFGRRAAQVIVSGNSAAVTVRITVDGVTVKSATFRRNADLSLSYAKLRRGTHLVRVTVRSASGLFTPVVRRTTVRIG
jgi:hypothetical protein